eukprot:CAMPEP_0181112464 /NCGR_PEP_ID=MMETSP1071-20121207/19828_1 /TAXON_ID=35127 /ORGANISM="Thalassiosira sp., Strain NH16" /LENGTH=808 /DNA_ID=CAMNT_0023196437 /DNA_START=68 /DNA_END=2494 /DNA_ORIENTATION=+
MVSHSREHSRPRRSSASASLAVVAAALFTHRADLALATGNDSSTWDVKARKGRRIRAESTVSGVDGNIGSSSNSSHKKKVNLLVKYKSSLAHRRNLEIIESGSADHNWQSHAAAMSTISDTQHIVAVEIDALEENLDLILEEMLADDGIELVEEDFAMYKYPYNRIEKSEELHLRHNRNLQDQPTSNTTMIKDHRSLVEQQQYSIEQIQADQVWSLTNSRRNRYPNTPVGVCIVDTGYDKNHEDLPKSGLTGTNTGYGSAFVDKDGHGTHCAGVIGALGNDLGIVGVNPNPSKFKLHISKSLNNDGMGTASSVLKGIQGCIESGSKIISLSLGGGERSEIFSEMYQDAYNKNLLVVAAAGNFGLFQDDYPSSYPQVISVGAVDRNGNRADFSNWNDQLELMAPGVDILSTTPGGGYGSLSGTSMATPFVAGVAALVWGYFPQCSNQQIRNVLALSAKSMVANSKGCNRRTGFGLIQAKDAFDMLDKYGCAAGGNDFDPPNKGAVGGCDQPLADLTALPPINTASFTSDSSGNGCQKLFLRMLTDGYAYETSWELTQVSDGEVLMTGPPRNTNFEDGTDYNRPASKCLEPGTYAFTIKDIYGDGITKPGYYSISLDGNTLATNSDFGSSETTQFTVSEPSSSPAGSSKWESLLFDDFGNGFGNNFYDGGVDAMYAGDKFGRNGLVVVKRGIGNGEIASIYSKNMLLEDRGGFTKFKVVFSFYANNSIERDDGFCLDYKANRASTWSRANCWESMKDFENGKWYDDTRWKFQPPARVTKSIRIRFRGFSTENNDRIFFDKVELYGRNELI